MPLEADVLGSALGMGVHLRRVVLEECHLGVESAQCWAEQLSALKSLEVPTESSDMRPWECWRCTDMGQEGELKVEMAGGWGRFFLSDGLWGVAAHEWHTKQTPHPAFPRQPGLPSFPFKIGGKRWRKTKTTRYHVP